MARVLLGWELGAGLWHAAGLREIANALRQRGHEVVLALADPVTAWPLLAADGFTTLQAPRCPAVVDVDHVDTPAVTAADILLGSGFGALDQLRPLVEAWQSLLTLVRPDVIVADHSPTLLLAAFGAIPVVEVGLGFTLPPSNVTPLAVLRHAPTTDAEARVSRTIAAVQRMRGRPAPATVAALYDSAARYICAFPELDPYAAHPPRNYAGTLGGWLAPSPPPSPPCFFAYLAADDPRIGTLLTGLVRSGVPGSFYLRGAPDTMRAELAQQGVTVLEAPAAMAKVVAEASVLVHHGGAGTTQQAGSAGRAQLIIPRHLEQHYNGSVLDHLGVGRVVARDATPLSVGRALREVARSAAHAEAAETWARAIASRGHGRPAAVIADACDRLTGA